MGPNPGVEVTLAKYIQWKNSQRWNHERARRFILELPIRVTCNMMAECSRLSEKTHLALHPNAKACRSLFRRDKVFDRSPLNLLENLIKSRKALSC
ncbi:cathepsin d [Plakobranchus ocellatus]|uniref:Cathepsin d n=1 Tax=Plakobranchus ocellatus TaxID=259542 RepID=A0AAV4DHP1_9GAST|nr:cathepsin d [Plakobranchus ocellatus]